MRRFFLCSQNNDSKNYGFIQYVFSDFVAAEFPKTPSPKPARIPPQTPPAGGKTAEAGRILSLRQIVSPCRVRINRLDFARNSFELCPINTAKIRNSNFRQKYGRREAPSVLHSPHKILILQGFATLRVAPRLPIQKQYE
ncbi:hypothetical protein H6790_02430 [Candidatus Nomurabacteria bacterium]|nr:hypothetical protein [Candidatus Nomurabacteria bacterium]